MSVKISALPATAAVTTSDLLEKVDGGSGVSQKATVTQLTTFLATQIPGYTAENVANKDTDGTLAANSDTKYASQKAIKTYVDTKKSVAIFNNTIAAASDGAAFTTQTWSKAALNTTMIDTLSAFTLAGSVLTVTSAGAGIWVVRAVVPIIDYNNTTNICKSRLRRTNNTAATLLVGGTHFQYTYSTEWCRFTGYITLAAGDTLELQGWCNNPTPQFGKANGVNTGESEVYSLIEFERV